MTIKTDIIAEYASGSGVTIDGVLLKDGALSAGLVAPTWKPAADSTTALKIQNAAGTANIVTVDTTNALVTLAKSGVGAVPTVTTANLVVVDSSAQAADVGGAITFIGKFTDAGAYVGTSAFIKGYKETAVTGEYGYGLKLGTRENGVGASYTRLTITGAGEATFGKSVTATGTVITSSTPTTSRLFSGTYYSLSEAAGFMGIVPVAANYASWFHLCPRGTGDPVVSGLNSKFTMFWTDYLADNANYGEFALYANATVQTPHTYADREGIWLDSKGVGSVSPLPIYVNFNTNGASAPGVGNVIALSIQPTSLIGVNAPIPTAQLHVDQQSSTAAVPVLLLDQADVSEPFIKLIGASTTDNSQSLIDAANLTTPGAVVGWVKIYVEDVQGTNPITDGVYWVPFYATPTS